MGIKRIAAVTVNRSDFGRMAPLYRKLQADKRFEFRLVAAVREDDPGKDAFRKELASSGIPARAEFQLAATSGQPTVFLSMAERLGLYLKVERPDLLLLLGDRFEVLPAATAAFSANIPVAHIGGGYRTLGALDDQVRDAISALATWHLVANERLARRVRSLGAKPGHVVVCGAPDIEALLRTPRLSRRLLLDPLGMETDEDFVLVTIHPETKGKNARPGAFAAAFEALLRLGTQVLLTAPAPDPGHEDILERIAAARSASSKIFYFPSLGMMRYVNAMRHAAFMFGNSSSGVIESSALGTPAVNLGDRQRGREAAANVVDCGLTPTAVGDALALVSSPEFKVQATRAVCPYGDGRFSELALAWLARL